jgi:hypothetical protein
MNLMLAKGAEADWDVQSLDRCETLKYGINILVALCQLSLRYTTLTVTREEKTTTATSGNSFCITEETMSQDGSDHLATERGFSETCCINWLELNSIRQRRRKICSGVRNATFFTEQCLYGYSGSLNLQQPKKPSNE